MRNMNLKPDRYLKTEVQQVLPGSRLKDLTAEQTRFELPVLYAKISLESQDSKLKTQFIKWSESKMEKASIEKPEQMINHITKTRPRTPEGEVAAFLQCLNYLYGRTGSFGSEP